MSLAVIERWESVQRLEVDPALRVHEESDAGLLASVTGRTSEEIERRQAAGHRAYLARQGGEPAAYGWVATRTATLGELGLTLHVGPEERYLWNFVTLRAWRGRGIYPRLLQAIIAAESRLGALRYWIAYAPENHASAAGIRKAGFTKVAELSFSTGGGAAVRPLEPGDGVRVAALLGVDGSATALSPCWKCVRAGRGAMSCAEGECACDYQRPETACATPHPAGVHVGGGPMQSPAA